MSLTTTIALGAVLLYDPEMKYWPYFALPDDYKNPLTFFICWVQELWFVWMSIAVSIPPLQVQVIAFDLLNVCEDAIGQDLLAG